MKPFSPVAAVWAVVVVFIGGAVAAPVGTGSSFQGPVGLQLYSLRAQFTRSVPEAIALTKGFGITEVEMAGTYNLPPDKIREMLVAAGLKPISGHFSYDRWKTNLAQVIAEAKALGLRYAGTAWINHAGDFKESDAREAIAVFNRAGAECAKQGIRFFYHSHGYEFFPHPKGTLMDLLIQETDPKHVSFQMDTTWVFFPGQDPAAWLRKYPGRWELMHLKDLKKGIARGELTGKTDPNNDVPLGQGQLNWPDILKAAKESGVKHYFIEDEAATAPQQIPLSLKYLEQVRF
ncbi:MAG TPA: sugar phosphate isomerase/epimerase [Verrucomicrobiota bacterium]|nr:sugar phosphate isomerase [Verrucomicrobiales bacterium]HRI12014.1 sugar phosphate isomerase/epimerase [Verrucomicrobiota bacterium]